MSRRHDDCWHIEGPARRVASRADLTRRERTYNAYAVAGAFLLSLVTTLALWMPLFRWLR